MVSILAIGDLYKLPPVRSCPIFKHPSVICEPGDLASLPWHDFKLHELLKLLWQKDHTFADVLNVVHVKVPEKDSYVDKILKSWESTVDENDPSYPKDAMHVYAHDDNMLRQEITNDTGFGRNNVHINCQRLQKRCTCQCCRCHLFNKSKWNWKSFRGPLSQGWCLCSANNKCGCHWWLNKWSNGYCNSCNVHWK